MCDFVGDPCLVCSPPMSDLSLSKSVSMINLFRNGSLSNIGPRWFFMFPRLPVIGCLPFFQSRAKGWFLRYGPCRPTASPPAPFPASPCSSVAPIIGVARCKRARHQCALVVHHHMQFDPEDPSHRRTPARGQALEHPVAADARIGADRQSGAVGDMDAGLCAGKRLDPAIGDVTVLDTPLGRV